MYSNCSGGNYIGGICPSETRCCVGLCKAAESELCSKLLTQDTTHMQINANHLVDKDESLCTRKQSLRPLHLSRATGTTTSTSALGRRWARAASFSNTEKR